MISQDDFSLEFSQNLLVKMMFQTVNTTKLMSVGKGMQTFAGLCGLSHGHLICKFVDNIFEHATLR